MSTVPRNCGTIQTREEQEWYWNQTRELYQNQEREWYVNQEPRTEPGTVPEPEWCSVPICIYRKLAFSF